VSRLGHILVLGLGASGAAAARHCAALLGGDVESVTAADAADTPELRALASDLEGMGVQVRLGATGLDGHWGLCIASPGIPPHSPLMSAAVAHCDEVVSEIEFAYRRSACPWVAITGTNGKTTTTALVAHLLTGGGIPAKAVGNIGSPAIEAVGEAGECEVLVAEVSSFQLALTSTFHPRAAVLLNITPDHIDWHGTYQTYAADKAKVLANLGPSDVAVIDVDDAGSAPFAEQVAASGVPVVRVSLERPFAGGATVDAGVLVLETRGGEVRLVNSDELLIKGPHNVSNALAAAAVAHALGVSAVDLQWGLRTFEPIEHRLEPAGDVGGVEWFNDSKATNPDAVLKAVAAFDDRPIVLLLGGRNKGNDFTQLAHEVAASTTHSVIVFGESAQDIARAFESTAVDVTVSRDLKAAVDAAAARAVPGDAVVLSPACASFDEFSNYEQRGREFKRLVAQLAESGRP